MNLNQILKELEKQAKEWDKILKGEVHPDPKSTTATESVDYLLKFLDKASHQYSPQLVDRPDLLQLLDKRCFELKDKIRGSVLEWLSFEKVCNGDHIHELIADDVYAFTALVRSSIKEPTKPKYPIRLINLEDFMRQCCEPMDEKVFRSRKEALLRAHRDKKIHLPQINEPKKGQKRKSGKKNIYDYDKLLEDWHTYQTEIPNPIPLKKEYLVKSSQK